MSLVCCDRCGSPRRFGVRLDPGGDCPPIRLCTPCALGFERWMKEFERQDESGIGKALSRTAIASAATN